MALLAAGEGPGGRFAPGDSRHSAPGGSQHGASSAGRGSAAVERGVRWLAATQLAEGSWDEPQFTGTGFPWDFSINYHLYRLVFPVTALGRYLHGNPVLGDARRAT
jgi:squalene-hopene/tetraprenyl-beta-curcumene cyclase